MAITGGYHGAHAILSLHSRLSGLKVISLDNARNPIGELEDSGIGQGDVIHIETPTNPSGTCTSIAKYAEIAKERNAVLLVDATFAPPPLQNPFDHGADIVMHSGTKYLGGHSDALCGVLATRRQKWVDRLRSDRAVLGNMMGNLEAWLVLRSLRTLEIRVRQQSSSAGMLVSWLQESLTSSPSSGSIIPSVIQSITHASLQHQDRQTWLDKQMPEGFGPVFSIFFQKEEMAKTWPSKLKLFTHATSLGGVESLVEWRRMSDRTVDGRIVRVSVGLEAWNDLRDDMLSGFQEIVGLAEGKNGAKDKSKAGDDEKVKEGVEGTAKMDRVEMEGDEEVKRKIEEVMHEVDLAMEDEGKNIVRENGKLSADEEKGKVEVNRDDRAEPEKVEDREVKIQEEEVKKGDTQAAGNEIKGQ